MQEISRTALAAGSRMQSRHREGHVDQRLSNRVTATLRPTTSGVELLSKVMSTLEVRSPRPTESRGLHPPVWTTIGMRRFLSQIDLGFSLCAGELRRLFRGILLALERRQVLLWFGSRARVSEGCKHCQREQQHRRDGTKRSKRPIAPTPTPNPFDHWNLPRCNRPSDGEPLEILRQRFRRRVTLLASRRAGFEDDRLEITRNARFDRPRGGRTLLRQTLREPVVGIERLS